MFSRKTSWIGAGLAAVALALAAGSLAAQSTAPAAPAAPDCPCVDGAEWVGEGRVAAALARAEARAALAPEIADRQVDAAIHRMEAALAVQDDGRNAFWISTDEEPGYLGIRMEEVGSDKAKELKLPAERGALVTYVAENSPAAKAGLKTNDVITDFDGQRVESTMALQRMVREVPAGRTVSLGVWRDGHSQTLSVAIGSRQSRMKREDGNFFFMSPDNGDFNVRVAPPAMAIPAIPAIPSTIETFRLDGMGRLFGAPMLGIDAEDLSGQLGAYFGAPDGQGVLVREVMPGTPAEKGGLKAGDVILRVDGKRVKTSEDLRSALRDKADKAAPSGDSEKTPAPASDLSVLRSGKEMVVHVELQPPMRKMRPARRVAV